MMRNIRWTGTYALLGTVVVASLICLAIGKWRADLFLGLGVAFLLALPSYWSLSWAIGRSDRAFYSVYVAGALYRLTGLFVTAYVVWRTDRFLIVPVLVSLVMFLFAFLAVEVYFLKRQVVTGRTI